MKWLGNTAQSSREVEYIGCISAEGSNPADECPAYDIKQSEDEASVMLELWGMQSTPSLPSLWFAVVELDGSYLWVK